jgi:signal transduction histidine kinase
VLAQKIVEAQQGTFNVDRQAGSAGAFSIVLPCVFLTAAAMPERRKTAWS